MKQSGLFYCSLFVGFLMLLLIASGAGLTGNKLEPPPPDSIAASAVFAAAGHKWFAVVVAVLALILAGGLILARGESRQAGWILGALVLIEGGLGTPAGNAAFAPVVPVIHACVAQLLFAAVAFAAVVTSLAWKHGADKIPDGGWPSLRSMATVTPVLVFVQILLGALFRHRVIGVMAHIAGAILIALLVLLLGMFVMQQCPSHKPLKNASVVLMSVAFSQVFLGIAAITARMMSSTNTTPVLAITAAHVSVGALTFGANIVLSANILRYITPKAG